jgi:hypothetical protein
LFGFIIIILSKTTTTAAQPSMNKLVLLATILLSVFLAVTATQRVPVISEVFTARTFVEVKVDNVTRFSGPGVLAVNQPKGKRLVTLEVDGRKEEAIYKLERYDLGKSYEIVDWKGHNTTCHVRNETGVMPLVWGWLSEATYSSKKIDGKDYDYWSLTRGYATIELAVLPTAPGVPVFLFVHGAERDTTIKFNSWDPTAPREAHFDVPTTCSAHEGPHKKNVARSCVSRSTMISRAQAWVNAKVPYNQGGTYQGYREDCSGYVSMAWEASKPGLTTYTLPSISHPISKSSLQPGDILLCQSEHVVLFGGWSSSDHTHYVAFEETRPGEGTVKRLTPYPYWYNTGCFLPYRYNHVC